MKVSLNSRTETKLNEILSIINESSHAHVINLMISAFLESLKAPNHSPAHGDNNANKSSKTMHRVQG